MRTRNYIFYIFFILILFFSSLELTSSHKVNSAAQHGQLLLPNKGTDIANSKGEKILDTTSVGSRIDRIWSYDGIDFHVEITLEDYESLIKLSVYNMLGKQVTVIRDGKPNPKGTEYFFNGADLPPGVYMCILQGSNFRDTEKFIVSR